MIHLRAFRAIDEETNCIEFAEGHRKVLEGFNIGNLTTNNVSWAYNPNVYVVMASDSNSGNLLGGIRVQIADGQIALPVENAISYFDPRIHDMVSHYAQMGGTSELCGLWNSRTLAPNVGITINLVIAGMALCSQLPVTSIFTLVAIHTLKIARQMGFRIETSIGNNGEFIYPNSDFITRILSMNPQTLDNTFDRYHQHIMDLRENPYAQKQYKIADNKSVAYSHDLELNKVGRIRYVG